MKILQVSTFDSAGGAEAIARNLKKGFVSRGHVSWLAVGHRRTKGDPTILELPDEEYRSRWSNFFTRCENRLAKYSGKGFGMGRLSLACRQLARMSAFRDEKLGHENFDFPGSHQLLQLPPESPDILLCHNLHGDYFDLRALSELSKKVPTTLLLHDEWILTGHCSYTFECTRWKTGCGECPDLGIYPRLLADGTAFNWSRKKSIFESSRLSIVTPSKWLKDEVDASQFRGAFRDVKCIPNGVDQTVFFPGDRGKARIKLGLPQDARVILFCANNPKGNPFKDFQTIRRALEKMGQSSAEPPLLLLVLGESRRSVEKFANCELRYEPYEADPGKIVAYYQAADVYLHAAKCDNFPTTIIEALSCGIPVVATAVGGISEQVKGLAIPGCIGAPLNKFSPHDATGVLIPKSDSDQMSLVVNRLLVDRELLQRLGQNAHNDALSRFNLEQQIESFLEWFKESNSQTKHIR